MIKQMEQEISRHFNINLDYYALNNKMHGGYEYTKRVQKLVALHQYCMQQSAYTVIMGHVTQMGLYFTCRRRFVMIGKHRIVYIFIKLLISYNYTKTVPNGIKT